MPDFYDSQSEEIKMVIAGIFKEFTDLGNANTNTPEHNIIS